MHKSLVLRGLLAGAVGGLLTFVFARIFAEPLIQKAVDYEGARAAALDAGTSDAHADMEVFSRTVQSNLGLGAAAILFGVAMGALFAVAYAIAYGRVGRVKARTLAVFLSLAAFVSVNLVPFVKYPANPPAIGNGETIRMRSSLFLAITGASVLIAILAVWLGRRLTGRYSTWNATLLAGGAYLAAMAVLMLLLPSFGDLDANRDLHRATETPAPLRDATGVIIFPGFDADLLFSFRLYSIGAQLLMWTAIGLVFGPLAERVLERPRVGAPAQAAV